MIMRGVCKKWINKGATLLVISLGEAAPTPQRRSVVPNEPDSRNTEAAETRQKRDATVDAQALEHGSSGVKESSGTL